MRRPLADKDGEIRELMAEDMRLFKPIADVDLSMVEAMAEFRRKLGRPKPRRQRSISGSAWPRTLSQASGRAGPAITPVSSKRCARQGLAKRSSANRL